jgi:hypothetical protein
MWFVVDGSCNVVATLYEITVVPIILDTSCFRNFTQYVFCVEVKLVEKFPPDETRSYIHTLYVTDQQIN